MHKSVPPRSIDLPRPESFQKAGIPIRQKTTALLAALFALLCLSGCQSQSAAQQYLTDTGEDAILAHFLPVAYLASVEGCAFDDPADISADDLFRFFVLANPDAEGYYDTQAGLYHIPVADITALLDEYFDGCTFDPAALTMYAEYDQGADALDAPALGFGTGSSNYTLGATSADGDLLTVTLTGSSELTITARLSGGVPKVLSAG